MPQPHVRAADALFCFVRILSPWSIAYPCRGIWARLKALAYPTSCHFLVSCTVGPRLMLFVAGPTWLSLALLNNECHVHVVQLIDLAGLSAYRIGRSLSCLSAFCSFCFVHFVQRSLPQPSSSALASWPKLSLVFQQPSCCLQPVQSSCPVFGLTSRPGRPHVQA